MSVRQQSLSSFGINSPIPGADPYRLLWSDGSSQLSDASPEHRMASSEALGITIDGDINPYTGSDIGIAGLVFNRTLSNSATLNITSGYTFQNALFTMTNQKGVTAIIPDADIRNEGIVSEIIASGNHTHAHEDGAIYYKPIISKSTVSGTVTSTKQTEIFYGLDLSQTSFTRTYDNVSGVYNLTMVLGTYIASSPTNITLNNGTLTANYYGHFLSFTVSPTGTSTAYGYYISGVAGADTNWAFYDISDAPWSIRGNISIGHSGSPAAQLHQIIDNNTVVGHLITGAASQSGNYLTFQNSSTINFFEISPNTSAAIPTMTMRTLFDSSDSVIARFTGPDRATAVNFDRISMEFYLDDSNENQAQFSEIEFLANSINAGGRYGGIIFTTAFNSSQIQVLSLGASGAGGVGVLFNNNGIDFDYQFRTDNVTQMFYIDGGLDTATFGSNTSLAFLGIDGQSDEIQLLVQGNATQTTDLLVVENSSGIDIIQVKTPAAATYSLTVTNFTDSVSNAVTSFIGNNRGTAVNNDAAYISFFLENSAGVQEEAGRITWILQNVTSGSENGQMVFSVVNNSTLLEVMNFDNNNVVWNESSADFNFRWETNGRANMFYMDGGNDSATFGSTTELAFVGIDGQADEIQLLVQGNGTQTAQIFTVETSAGTDVFTVGATTIGFFGVTPTAQGASVADASGGVVIDAEARTALNALISRIEAVGLIATV